MQSGLVLHLPFEEQTGTVANDSSRYKNTGTLSGVIVPEWKERGLYFNGSNAYIDCGNGSSLNITNRISISSWIKLTSFKAVQFIAGKRAGAEGWYFDVETNKLLFSIYQSDGTEKTVSSINGIPNTNWYCVTGVADGAFVKMYINITEYIGNAYNNTIKSNISPVLIGQISTFNAARYFNGFIDDVRIYNRALSANEIAKYYEETKHKYL